MTAYMPQPDPMTAADVDEIAVFLEAEAAEAREVGFNKLAKSIAHTALHLQAKAERMRQ
ncbi:hypothetical protein AB0383_20210 [Amycolatopsis sp. NPDC051373]|uniref:hypothetical protein n=1 Tax=Amycolatopsis sp. NPDC051373 TaxID=3155801 RepID=UPI00344D785B